MKSYLSILIICSIIFLACSSTPRFTSEDNSNTRDKREKSLPEDNKRTEIIKDTRSGSLETVTGVASFYSEKFHGRQTANGEVYDMHAFTAAHENYPFNTIVKVTNLKNKKAVTLRINDRKPDFNGRIIDISYKAAQELDMLINGIAHVQVEVIKWGN